MVGQVTTVVDVAAVAAIGARTATVDENDNTTGVLLTSVAGP